MTSQPMRNVDLDDDVWDEHEYPPPYSETTVKDDIPEDKSIGFRREYLFSVPGALKCFEIVLSLIAFIAVLAGSWSASGFVAWTTITGFIFTTILFVVIAFNVYGRLPGFFPVYELIFLLLYTLKFFISTIIAGVGAALSPTVVAACAICACAFFVYLMDAIMAYKRLKAARAEQTRNRASGQGGRKDTFCIIF